MSHFSAVDAAPDISSLEAYLDRTARSLGAMKQYIVGAHVAAGSRVVLDVGCGLGHDLDLLARAGITALGVEPSRAFATTARQRSARGRGVLGVVRAHGERLPLRDAAVDGCRVERVLQHADGPELLLREVCRCVRPDGLLTVVEPDWTTMRVASDSFDDDARWLANVRHPEIGACLAGLVEQAGARIVDVVEEHSVWHSLERARAGINIEAALARNVAADAMSATDAAMWLGEQRGRDDRGLFRATITKRLVVARVR